jgi:hypothetical protein
MFKSIILLVSTGLVLSFGYCSLSYGEETPERSFGFNTSADVVSKFVWRGISYSKNPVFQPSVTFGYKGASINVWSNMDLGDENGKKGIFSEFDYTLDYTYDIDNISFSLGALNYTYPDNYGVPTTEIYIGAVADVPVNPEVFVYHDVRDVNGTYISIGGGTTLPVAFFEIELSALLGMADKNHNYFYYKSDKSSLTDIFIGAGIPLTIAGKLSITPNVSFTSVIDKNIRQSFDKTGMDKENILFGVNFSADF